MTVNEAIARANELRMNTLGDEIKMEWLRTLDGQLLEMMQHDVGAAAHEDGTAAEQRNGTAAGGAERCAVWPDAGVWPEENPELLMGAPHEMVYVYHLVAQIDYHNQESDLYANDLTLYNTAMRDARAWWRRNHRPKDGGNWKVM